MWTPPREDMTLKKICPYLTQAEETVMVSNPCQAFLLQSNLVSLFCREKERNGTTGPCKNSNRAKVMIAMLTATERIMKKKKKKAFPEM